MKKYQLPLEAPKKEKLKEEGEKERLDGGRQERRKEGGGKSAFLSGSREARRCPRSSPVLLAALSPRSVFGSLHFSCAFLFLPCLPPINPDGEGEMLGWIGGCLMFQGAQ